MNFQGFVVVPFWPTVVFWPLKLKKKKKRKEKSFICTALPSNQNDEKDTHATAKISTHVMSLRSKFVTLALSLSDSLDLRLVSWSRARWYLLLYLICSTEHGRKTCDVLKIVGHCKLFNAWQCTFLRKILAIVGISTFLWIWSFVWEILFGNYPHASKMRALVKS